MKHKNLLVLGMAATIALALTGCTKTVDLTQYADVTYSGANGNGSATIDLDYGGLGKELFGKDATQSIIDEAQTELSLMGNVDYTLDKEDGLSNGDTITMTVTCSDSFAKTHEIKLKNTTKKITVSGLPEAKSLDPFSPDILTILYDDSIADGKVTINLLGAYPDINVRTNNRLPRSDPRYMLMYNQVDNEDGSENDDHITIKAEPRAGLRDEFDASYTLAQDTYEISLDDVPRYLTQDNQIPDNLWEQVQPEIDEIFADRPNYGMRYTGILDADCKSADTSDTNTSDPSWNGNAWLLVDKDGDGVGGMYYGHNMLVIPYSLNYKALSGGGSGTAIGGVYFTDVLINSDGTLDFSKAVSGITAYYTDLDAFRANEVDNRAEYYDIAEFSVS